MPAPLIIGFRSGLCFNRLKQVVDTQKRFLSAEIIKKQNQIFNAESKRQRQNVGRIEKIEVRYMGVPEDATFMMNKNISTPYNVAQHLSETHCNNSPIALIDNQYYWDMHRPIQESCTLQLLNFKITEPYEVNRIFWRSCSFLLGAVMTKTFKEDAGLVLHSFPPPNVRSGSFVHDISLKESSWHPSEHDLRTLGAEMTKLSIQDIKFERLEVTHDIALEMFKDNPFKREQLPNISNKNNGNVTIYRVGDHIDISKGPMVGSTRFLHRIHVSSVHKVSTEKDNCNLYRVQGVALPFGFPMSAFAFNVLTDRAKKLNPARLPLECFEEVTDTPKAAQRSI